MNMLDKARRRMTPEEFYAWQETQDDKYELVDGYRELGKQLRGGPRRRGFTSDTAVSTVGRTRRRPDAGVDCGQLNDQSHDAGDVRLVAEVLSPSTHEFDLFGKLDEYKTVETLEHILLIEPNSPQAILWSRTADRSWGHAKFKGLDASIRIESIGVTLILEEVYSGLTFRPSPKLIERGGT
jgi:Uma2 family endonuclease